MDKLSSVEILGARWHPEHLLCTKCGASHAFFELDSQIFCENCFRDVFSSRCASCGGSVSSNVIEVGDRIYHDSCFQCTDCRGFLAGLVYYELGNDILCHFDYHRRMGLLCKGCSNPIESSAITFNGDKFHGDCFCCTACSKGLAGSAYKVYKDRQFCKLCFNKRYG
eukprot:TRINITY_DN12818_c0_g1_i1.p1 TRINITY_DN12818_c0_g1~~TRINITY_DN12818_c0_g1_i1.p1  ORF type:complete len:167 (-),score=27.02 TRINITY_DN12818_c0_g1_i1:28-528(-)